MITDDGMGVAAFQEASGLLKGAALWLVRTYPDVVPSVKSLDEDELELMSEALEVHKDWMGRQQGGFVSSQEARCWSSIPHFDV